MAPVTRGDIKNYIKVYLGVDIPDKRVCKGHNSPMEYLWHSYFTEPSTWFDDAHHRSLRAGFAAERPANGDAIVWANRAGGKTELAAIATLLDCVFKPGRQRLIEAMGCYRYPEGGRAGSTNSPQAGELPLKDGLYDHPIDALRYFFVNYKHNGKTTNRRY